MGPYMLLYISFCLKLCGNVYAAVWAFSISATLGEVYETCMEYIFTCIIKTVQHDDMEDV